MSDFSVQAHTLTIEPHPDPEVERLEIARVGDYQCVVGKGQYKTGDVALYIPEQSIVPVDILSEMGLTKEEDGVLKGSLAGKDGQRVKAIRLRGVLSQGLIFSPNSDIAIGRDYAEQFGITKYLPPVPMEMSGQVEHVSGLKSYTDIENIKKWPDVFEDGEPVYITEKLHGSCTIASLIDGDFYVSSKGLASKELCILESEGNVYWRAARQYQLEEVCKWIAPQFGDFGEPVSEVTIFGEVLGVQDLRYGLQKGQIDWRLFDIRVDGEYLSYDEVIGLGLEKFDIPMVPGLTAPHPFNKDFVLSLSQGETNIGDHIREGVVIRSQFESFHPMLGRKILKSINPDYLLRKGKATEYE